jgi:hypothetical protein
MEANSAICEAADIEPGWPEKKPARKVMLQPSPCDFYSQGLLKVWIDKAVHQNGFLSKKTIFANCYNKWQLSLQNICIPLSWFFKFRAYLSP